MNAFLQLSYIILVQVPKREMLSKLILTFQMLRKFRLLETEAEVEEGEKTNASDFASFVCGYLRLYIF